MAEPRERRPPQRELPDHVTTPLLTLITTRSMDEDYAHVARQRAATGEGHVPRARPHWASLVAIGVLGLMAAVVAAQTDRQAPVEELSRAALIEEIDVRSEQVRGLQSTVSELGSTNQELARSSSRTADQLQDLEARVRRAELITGYSAVHGPGVRITVDNREDAVVDDQVRDEDLAVLVDGLWAAGAEAIAINDQRLTALGGIRNTNRAVHVNGRPVNAPYVVSVIGDNQTLQARLLQTYHGQQWFSRVNAYGFVYTPENVDDIRLPAAPERALRDVIELTADPDGTDGEGSAP